MSKTRWKNHAPASVSAAMNAIASAATSAGSAERRAGAEWAAALSVTVVLPEHHDAQNQTIASYPDATKLSRQATITSARVDPRRPPAIFRPLRRTGPPARDRRPLWRNW